MIGKMLTVLALAGAIAVAGAPQAQASAAAPGAASVSLQPGVTYRYNYFIFRADGIGFEHTGTLALRFTPGGIIGGYSGYNFDFPTIPVWGGRSGNTFWLDIGSLAMRPFHVEGTIGADGSLHAYGFGTGRSNAIYTFTAKLN